MKYNNDVINITGTEPILGLCIKVKVACYTRTCKLFIGSKNYQFLNSAFKCVLCESLIQKIAGV